VAAHRRFRSIFGEPRLRSLVKQLVEYYLTERYDQGLGSELITAAVCRPSPVMLCSDVSAGISRADRAGLADGWVASLSGNVREWEDSCDGIGQSANCLLRGGCFSDNGSLTCAFSYGYGRDIAYGFVGFRCCSP
jgi:hypothetical protein